MRVDADALVSGEVQTGFRAAMTVLARGWAHIAASEMGLPQVLRGRVLIGERQLVQAMLAEQ